MNIGSLETTVDERQPDCACLLVTPLQKVSLCVGPMENPLFPTKLVQRSNQIAIVLEWRKGFAGQKLKDTARKEQAANSDTSLRSGAAERHARGTRQAKQKKKCNSKAAMAEDFPAWQLRILTAHVATQAHEGNSAGLSP